MTGAIPYAVVITPDAGNGFIVQVGCKTFAYTERERLVSDLAEYIRTPQVVCDRYFAEHDGPPEQPPAITGQSERPRLFESRAAETFHDYLGSSSVNTRRIG